MVDLFLNIFIFVGIMLLMSMACINMVNVKGDGRNSSAGYRTKRSQKSKEAWNIGNKTFGYCSFMIPVLEGVSIYLEFKILIPMKIVQSKDVILINLLVLTIAGFVCYLITENKLKKL